MDSTDTGPARLETRDLTVTYGGLRAADGVSLSVPPGGLVGLIGPNGAGKTTLLDAITGFVASSGSVTLETQNISSWAPYRRARAGLLRTWQTLELFDDLPVTDNLRVAAEAAGQHRGISDDAVPATGLSTLDPTEILSLVGIPDVGSRLPAQLSHGQRRLVGVARAMAGGPLILCLDEPASGLDSTESQAFGAALQRIREAGASILVVDHDMRLMLSTCDYIYVMDFGKIIAAGPPDAVRSDPRVVAAYLGHRE